MRLNGPLKNMTTCSGIILAGVIVLLTLYIVYNVFMYAAAACGAKFAIRWRCEHDDHTPDDRIGLSGGINLTSRCKHCGKHIIMDSSGSWFSIDPKPYTKTPTENE